MKMMKKLMSVFLTALLLVCAVSFASAECAHQYDATFYPPTCNDQGYTEYVCNLCGDRMQEGFVAATGHIYGEWQDLSAPTCTENGLQKRTCRVCQGIETRTLPMTAHADTDDDNKCDNCDFIFEEKEEGGLSPYEWFKLLFANIIAWFRAIFA